MLFYSFFKTLTGKEVTVELKNDLAITGILHSVDQYLNIKLNEIKVVDEAKHPHLVSSSPPRSASSYADMPTDPPPAKTHSLFFLVVVVVASTQLAVKNCFIRGSVVRYIQVSSKVRAAKDPQRAVTPSTFAYSLSLSLSLLNSQNSCHRMR